MAVTLSLAEFRAVKFAMEKSAEAEELKRLKEAKRKAKRAEARPSPLSTLRVRLASKCGESVEAIMVLLVQLSVLALAHSNMKSPKTMLKTTLVKDQAADASGQPAAKKSTIRALFESNADSDAIGFKALRCKELSSAMDVTKSNLMLLNEIVFAKCESIRKSIVDNCRSNGLLGTRTPNTNSFKGPCAYVVDVLTKYRALALLKVPTVCVGLLRVYLVLKTLIGATSRVSLKSFNRELKKVIAKYQNTGSLMKAAGAVDTIKTSLLQGCSTNQDAAERFASRCHDHYDVLREEKDYGPAEKALELLEKYG
eukprot:m.115570 g.115570  ORF g.115570 m.115570 type:complete len:311 (+) comp15497_c0_seq6:151-1083(+)